MDVASGERRCPACGRPAPADRRFCVSCGARIAGEPTSAPAPESPSARPELQPAPAAPVATLATPASPPQERWALGTPPASESWWRNPVVVALALATFVLGGGGVASWRFFASSASSSPGSHLSPRGDDPRATVPGSTAPVPPTPDEAATVAAIDDIVQQSEAGLRAVRDLDYAGALRNRRRLVRAVEELDVPAQSERLAGAVATLHDALAASASADQAHIDCGCDERLAQDVDAHRLKHRFAREFDSYAQRYLGHSVDPERI